MKVRQFIWERLRSPFVSRKGDVEYPETFHEELNDQCGRIILFAAVIFTFSWLPYIPIDRQLYPGEPLIVALRVGLSLVGFTVLILQSFRRFNRHSLTFLIILSAYLEAATGVITGLTKADPAYMGGYLFVLTLMALVPIPRRVAWSILAASLLLFFTVGLASGMRFDTLRLRYSLNDLLATILIVALFVYLLDRLRFSSWEKSRKIDQQNETLRENEEFSTQLITAIPDIVIRTNIQGEILYINEKGLEVSGYAKEDIVGQNILSFVAPEDLEAAVQNTILMMEQPLGPKEYHLILNKEAKSIYEVNGSVLKKEDGVLYGMVYVIRDIAERKRAEEALRESEEKLRLIFNTIPHVVSILDMNLRCTYISPSIERLMGYTPEEALTLTLDQLMTPESLQIAVKAYQEDLEQEQAPDFSSHHVRVLELDAYHKGGSLIPFENTITFLRDDKGVPIGIVILSTDISERKRAEEALRESEDRLRNIIEGTQALLLRVDVNGTIIYANDATAEALGYKTAAEIIGRLYLDFVYSDDRRRVLKSMIHQAEARKPSSIHEFRVVDTEGRVKWFSFLSTLVIKNGQFVGMTGVAQNITERKQAEEALRESEARYRTFFDQAAVGVAEIEHFTGRFLTANRRLCELLGRTEEEMRDTTFQAITHPDDLHLHEDKAEQLLAGTIDHYTLEKRYISKDGTVIWVNITVSDPREIFETRGRNIVIVEDIAERKRTEKALRESEEKYRLLAENSNDVIWTTDTELRYTYYSPAVRKLRGLEPEEAKAKTLAETVTPASLNALVSEYMRHLPDIEKGLNPTAVIEIEEYRKDGSTVWVEISMTTMRDKGGILTGYVGVTRNISERKKQEEALRESENKYRFLIENSNDIVWTFDLKKMAYSFCSHSVMPILGYSSEESVGMILDDIFSPDTKESIRTAFGKIIGGAATTDRVLIEAEHIAKDGRKVWMEINAVVQKDQTGKPSLINGISRDITERKRVEAALQASKNAADAANRSKSIFLANMSHEIRTPMNAILGFAQLMQREPDLSLKSREHLDIINRSGEHLLSLINDILEMSKIEAGRATFVPSTFDLYSLLNDLERMFHVRTDAKNLRFLMEKVGHVPRWVITDAGKLRQVLINLLGNAVKFTAEGGISLRICAKTGKADTLDLKFEVEDTGPGMAEEEIGRLFQAFEQTKAGLNSGGTGLGLALSRGFVQIMGGSIAVTSTPGKGTTFRFVIPVQEGVEEHAPMQEVKRRVLRLSPGQSEIRVLIADDRETNRQLLSQLLGVIGFTTREAVNGAEALRMVHEWKPRVVLMDMTMPVMDGYDATRKIKESPAIKDTAIVAVTASAFEDDKQRILAAGADGYLSKPFKDAELFETIGRLTGVEYLYEEADGVEKALEAADDMTLMRKTVAALPPNLVGRIRDAVEGADLDLLNQIAGQLVTDQPSLAQRMQEMAARYEYDALIELFSPGE